MANLNALPKEILHKIISYMGSNLPNLVECSRVCKSLSEVANAALYHHIDLKRDEKYDEEADEKTDRRQARLIRSIAEYDFACLVIFSELTDVQESAARLFSAGIQELQ